MTRSYGTKSRGFPCKYGRLHNTQAEADVCNLSPRNKHFDQYPKIQLRKPSKTKPRPTPVTPEFEDSDPFDAPPSPASTSASIMEPTSDASKSTPAQGHQRGVYPTPFSQETQKAGSSPPMDDNIHPHGLELERAPRPSMSLADILARSRQNVLPGSAVWDPRNGTPNGPPKRHMNDGSVSPLEPYSKPIDSRQPTASLSPSIQGPDTPVVEQGSSLERPGVGEIARAKAKRALEALGIARAELGDALTEARADHNAVNDESYQSTADQAALINRLLTRNRVEKSNVRAKELEIERIIIERNAAQTAADAACSETEAARQEATRARRWSKLNWLSAALVFALWAMYMIWCWINHPDFVYIRKMRFEMNGLECPDCPDEIGTPDQDI